MTVTSLDSEWNNLAALPMDIIISYSLHPVNLCRKTGVLFLPANQHAPLLHLGSFLRQQGGTCPLGHCGGSRHREAVTFPPEEIFKRTPPLENAFGYFYRFIKVAAGAGCVTPQERGMGNPPHKKTSPHLTVWAGLSLDCLSNNQTTLS